MSAATNSTSRKSRWLVGLAALAALALALLAGWMRAQSDPNIPLLVGEHGAHWIRSSEPFDYTLIKPKLVTQGFRKKFRVSQPVGPAIVTIRAMKSVEVYLDGAVVRPDDHNEAAWKQPIEVMLPLVTAGEHELGLLVSNGKGPPMFLAWSDELDLRSGADWEVTFDGQNWEPVLPATHRDPTPISRKFPSVAKAFADTWWLTSIAAATFALAWFIWTYRSTWAPPSWSSATAVRSVLFAGWIVLSLNNFLKVPIEVGYDAPFHLQYVLFILEEGRLPLATDRGWQLFQSPLFYILATGWWKVLTGLFGVSRDTMPYLLRLIPMLCGLAQIELCYRAVKQLYPSRADLQAVGALLGGLMPMNIYMSQFTNNEPLCACLTAATLVLLLQGLRTPSVATTFRWQALVGGTLGLAILSKISPLLLIPHAALAVAIACKRGGASTGRTLAGLAVATVAGAAACAWWFARNIAHFGKPVLHGWDPARSVFNWWQQPGYRTPSDFLSFGESLSHPVYSAQYGVWDSLYSTMWLDAFAGSISMTEVIPIWNYGPMIAAAWWSLLPMTAILLGVGKTFTARDTTQRLMLSLALTAIAAYLAAMVWLYLQLPIYSTAKASYTLGLLPCYALLGAAGFELFTRQRWLAILSYNALWIWAVFAFAAYFKI